MSKSIEFRYEKYGAIALAPWFMDQGYEVQLSVPGPLSELVNRKDLGGIEPPLLSDFDTDDPQTRYEIYYDSPGHIDLVARNSDELWIIEAKGLVKGGGAPGAIAAAIGQVILHIDPSHSEFRYGVLLPKEERYLRVIAEASVDNPIFCDPNFKIFWVSKTGNIEVDEKFSDA